jgi:hypothetical protein
LVKCAEHAREHRTRDRASLRRVQTLAWAKILRYALVCGNILFTLLTYWCNLADIHINYCVFALLFLLIFMWDKVLLVVVQTSGVVYCVHVFYFAKDQE